MPGKKLVCKIEMAMSLKNRLILSCEKATFLIVKREEQPLSLSEKVRLVAHLSICKFCRNFAKQSEFISRHTSHLTSTEDLSEEDKLQLLREIEKNL